MRLFALATLALLLAPSTAVATEWVSDDAETKAHFEVTHLMFTTVRGFFSDVKATLDLDEKNIARSSITATASVASIDTGNDKRDGHLKSGDFFDAEKHPTLSFKSTKVKRAGKNALKVIGELTIRGKTLPVTFKVKLGPEVKHPFSGAPTRGFRAEATINRTKYGLTWNKALEAGGFLLGEEVKIIIDAEFHPKKEETASTE